MERYFSNRFKGLKEGIDEGIENNRMVDIDDKYEEYYEEYYKDIEIKMGYFWCRPGCHFDRSSVGNWDWPHANNISYDLPFMSCKTEWYLHVVTFDDPSFPCHVCELSCEARSAVPP